MAQLIFSRDSLAKTLGSYLAPVSYDVNVYPAAAVVNGNQTGTSITVFPGHAVPVGGGKVAAFSGGLYVSGSYQTASSSTGTTVVLPSSVTLSDGDLIVYLGTDTGTTSPNYDGSTLSIYGTPQTTTALTESKVTADSGGEFEYWVRDTPRTLIVRSGTTVKDVSQVEPLASRITRDCQDYATGGSGTTADPWTGWEAAFTGIPSTGGTIEFSPGVYSKTAAASLPVNLTGWLSITGPGATIVLSASGSCAFDIPSHSDYDTLKYIRLEGLNISGNQVAGSLTDPSPRLLGAVGSIQKRMNYSNLVIRDIVITDVSETGHTEALALQTTHPTGGETSTSCSDILIDNLYQSGGNSSIVLTSSCDDSSLNMNHTFERITIRNHYHKSANQPAAIGSAASIQLGSVGLVKNCYIEDSYWQNSSDVGIEVDNPYGVTVKDCTAVDCFGIGFYAVNFSSLGSTSQSHILFERCRVLISANSSTAETDFIGFSAQTAISLPVISATFKDCYFENLDNYVHRVFNCGSYTNRVVLDGLKVTCPNLVDATTANYQLFNIVNYYSGSTTAVRNCEVNITQDSGGNPNLFSTFLFDLENGRIEVENVVINATFTGIVDSPYFIGINTSKLVSLSQIFSGYVRGVKMTVTGPTAARSTGINFNQYIDSSSNVVVENCDLSGMPSGSVYLRIESVADTPALTFRDNVTTGGGPRTGMVNATYSVIAPRGVGTWPVVSATSGTDTACTNGTAYVGSIYVPQTFTITGVQYLVGSVGGTDKVIVSIHDSIGSVLANSATAGTTVGTAATLQQVALTSTYVLIGPGTYFLALTFNGTTAKFRTVPAYCDAGTGIIGGSVTQTFGTPATFTAPTTFTADKVPVASLY